MLAVREEARGRHIGDRLKHFQRERVQKLGVETMLWTADPLVARNAHFNINRLGARPVEYVENIYGANTGSTLHGELPTDRLVISWALSKPYSPSSTLDAEGPGDCALPLANPLGSDGRPAFDPEAVGPAVRVQVPHDLTVVQRDSVDDAMYWRLAVRGAFNALHASGHTVTRFVRPASGAHPYYVLEVAR
jgi:predicted GNAT superfamily acetyltransferase